MIIGFRLVHVWIKWESNFFNGIHIYRYDSLIRKNIYVNHLKGDIVL